MTKQRDSYWDLWRGVAIIAVVWIHARPGGSYAGWEHDYWIVAKALIRFPVALFLFISGYMVNADKLRAPGAWLKRRMVRLLVPFFVWSGVYTIIEAAKSRGEIRPLSTLVRFVFGFSAMPLYFILVLVQLTVLTPLLARALRTRWIWAWYALTPVYIVLLYAWAIRTGGMPPKYYCLFPGCLCFYLMGMQLRQSQPSIPAAWMAAGVAASTAAGVAESYALLHAGVSPELAGSQLSATGVLSACFLLLLVYAMRRPARPSLLSMLGVDSYGVYYVHVLWMGIISPAFDGGGVFASAPLPAIQAMQVVTVIAASLLTMMSVRKLAGRRPASRLLGF
jgi:fucose 4-O-acetylase-like acetyltransferase